MNVAGLGVTITDTLLNQCIGQRINIHNSCILNYCDTNIPIIVHISTIISVFEDIPKPRERFGGQVLFTLDETFERTS